MCPAVVHRVVNGCVERKEKRDLPLRREVCVYCNVGGVRVDETVFLVFAWGVIVEVREAGTPEAGRAGTGVA